MIGRLYFTKIYQLLLTLNQEPKGVLSYGEPGACEGSSESGVVTAIPLSGVSC